MADKITTAQTIRQLAVLFEGMVDAANTLEAIGSLENAVIEATAAKDVAVAERYAAVAEMETALIAVRAAKSDADQIIAEAHECAATLKEAAEAEAMAITKSAKDQADALIVEAKQQSDESVADTTNRLTILRAKIGDIKSDIATLEARRNAANAAADAADARFANAKDAIKKLMAE